MFLGNIVENVQPSKDRQILLYILIWAVPFLIKAILLFILIIAIIGDDGDESTSTTPSSSQTATTKNISPNVTKWESTIFETMQKYHVPENLLPYILALTMQESGGKHADIMQSSESMCNGKIGCIHDPHTSIEYGIKHFHTVWTRANRAAAEVTNPAVKSFENLIKITLQAYNFGPGFVDYVFQHNGIFSEQLAKDFALSHSKTSKCGWRSPYCYGDYKYVEHVFRYLNFSPTSPAIVNVSNTELVTNPGIPIRNWPKESMTAKDPTNYQYHVTPRTANMYNEVISNGIFSLSGSRSASCFSIRSRGEHPKGRACDFVFQFRHKAKGKDLLDGNKLANYLVLNQQRLGVEYVIWKGLMWSANHPEKGWHIYPSSYYHCPMTEDEKKQFANKPYTKWTGCHFDHVHVSMY